MELHQFWGEPFLLWVLGHSCTVEWRGVLHFPEEMLPLDLLIKFIFIARSLLHETKLCLLGYTLHYSNSACIGGHGTTERTSVTFLSFSASPCNTKRIHNWLLVGNIIWSFT
jgi:hypothetical protein